MSWNKCLSLNCFATQYILTFLSLLLVFNLSCCLGCLVSLAGRLFIVSTISWFVTKKIRKRLNNELLTSYKRAVLITGCDSGFGHALAQKMNEHGFRVYATVLDPEGTGAQKLLTGARFDGKTKVLRMDVRSDEEVNGVYEQIQKDLAENGEELWAVVNNAGILTVGPLDWGTLDTYKNVFDVNTFGTVRVTRTFLPLLRQSKGRIVNLVSMAGRLTSAHMAVYSMSKHAVISFSDALRRETKRWGIKVSTIEPMAYRTPMADDDIFTTVVDKHWAETSDEVKELYGEDYYKEMRQLSKKNPIGKVGDDIYEVIDKMVDAVRSPDPQIRYPSVAGGCRHKLAIFVGQLLPNEIFDQLVAFKLRKSLKPAQLRNKN